MSHTSAKRLFSYQPRERALCHALLAMWPGPYADFQCSLKMKQNEYYKGKKMNKFQKVGEDDLLLFSPPVESHLITSKYVQQTFKIEVMRPSQRRGETRKYPVVYATDGNMTFDMFKQISNLIQMSEQDAPPFILVGIGYPGDSHHVSRQLRARDFMAPPAPACDMKSLRRVFEEEILPEDGAKDYNGAEDFRRFISEELVPFIDARYPTIEGDRTYFGHSGGGFFGLYTLFTESSLFRNYIVSSPGLLFHGQGEVTEKYENYDCGAQMVHEFIASGKSLDGIKLYMSVGAEEEFEAAVGLWRLVSGFYQVAKQMKSAAIPGLQLMTEVFQNETHMTVWPIAFTHGVQAVFGTRRVYRSVYF